MSSSVASLICDLITEKKLFRYVPANTRHSPKRAVYLTEKARKEIDNSALQILAGKAHILDALDTWVMGKRINGDNKRGEYIVPLYPPPPDVWEIKVRAPHIQGRMFVRFLAADTLVMTHTHTRKFLDDGFQDAMDECANSWNLLLPNIDPFRGSTIHDYITSECDDFPSVARKPKRR